MKKFIFIAIVILISGILHATTYYVSPNGNDAMSGTSPGTSWQTIERVNKAKLTAGDSVLFKRGEIFRGNLIPLSGSPSGYITYGAFGNGDKPKLFGSYQRNSPSDWINAGENIWVTSQIKVDVGNIIFNNESFCGIKVWNESDLNSRDKFWYDEDNDLLKLFSYSNPANYYSNIELALRTHIIDETNRSYVKYENLDLRYGGAHGIGGSNTDHIWIKGLNISYIGGGDQRGGTATVRYGNGVEFWNAAHDNIVERCTFNQIYDAAMTAQGMDSVGFEAFNIFFRNNIVNNSEYSFEYWERYGNTIAHDIYFENNTCLNAGSGWGHSQRRDPNGTHLMLYNGNARTSNVYIRNNIFYNSTNWGVRWTNASEVNKVIVDYNCWYESSGLLANIQNTYYDFASQWEAYKNATGQDAHSINKDPLLNPDFSLTNNSPCIGAGISLNTVTENFNGLTRPKVKRYNIGAF